jgi:hypothetical protein
MDEVPIYRHPASGPLREEYEKRMEIWRRIVKEPLFQFLKHGPGRHILYLLANEEISLGKCAEAITELYCLEIEPDLPEGKGMKMTDNEQSELDELRENFNLRWAADMRAIKMWQAAHPERVRVWPDHADLCVWLMEQIEKEAPHGKK